MRWTYTDIKNDFLDKVQKTGSVDANLLSFFQRNMGARYQLLLSRFTNYLTQKAGTASTVASQQQYHKPVGVSNIETATITISTSGIVLPLQVIDSQARWDAINRLPNFTSTFPKYILNERDTFRIWPTPQSSGNTITLNYHLRDRNLTNDDYTTSTINVSNNSQTATGSGVTFTAAMVGRWISITGDGFWYRIAAVPTSTTLTFETSFEGVSNATAAYRIGETPELPEEMHPLLSIGSVSDYFAGPRGDVAKATWWNNMYFTGDGNNSSRDTADVYGGLLGAIRNYSERSDSGVVHHYPNTDSSVDKAWATTISS